MGGTLQQTLPGEPTKEIARSPISPVAIASEKERQALNLRFWGTPEPPPGESQATLPMIRLKEQQAVNTANIDPNYAPGATAPTTPQTPTSTPTANLQQFTVQTAKRYGIPPALALSLFQQESHFDNTQVNPDTGAFSAAQFTPQTVASRKLDGNRLRTDPQYAIDEGLKYFSELVKSNGGDVDKALLEYGGAVSPDKQRAYLGQVYQHYPGFAQQLSGQSAAPARGAKAQQAADIKQAEQDVQLGRPGATQPGIATETLRQRQNMEVYGTPEPPQGKSNATAEDVEAKHTRGHALPSEVIARIAPLQEVQHYVQQLDQFPEDKVKDWVGLLRGTKADVENLFKDIEKAGAGDPERYRWLSIMKQMYYLLNRPDVGANFSLMENALVGSIFATGGERTYSEYKGKIDRLPDILKTKIDTLTHLATTTRGELGKGGAGAKEPAAAKETPEQIEDRIRARQGLPPRTK